VIEFWERSGKLGRFPFDMWRHGHHESREADRRDLRLPGKPLIFISFYFSANSSIVGGKIAYQSNSHTRSCSR